MGHVLLINGWSNSGKSTFTNWLALSHGFTLVDADNRGIDSSGLRPLWEQVGQGNAAPFVTYLQGAVGHTVIDWPYNPPVGFPFVAALQGAGLPCWWFDADPVEARLSFMRRGRRTLAEFDAHAGAIAAHRHLLPGRYGARYLRTLHPSGIRLQHDDIWAFIRSVEAW